MPRLLRATEKGEVLEIMGETTGIAWCDHTFNPWWGCEKVSPACDHCYAESTSNRYGFKIWGQDSERRFFGERHWNEPLKWNAAAEKAGVRRRVFCASMADVMEDRRDLDGQRIRLRTLIRQTSSLDWLLLTKRPENFSKPEFAQFDIQNIWGMTTVESEDYLWRADQLLSAPFALRGLSMEPLLGRVNIEPYICPDHRDGTAAELPKIHWVIVGAESGSGARPMQDDWARNIRDRCQEAGVAFFMKQMLVDGKLTKDVTKFPADLQIQQFPQQGGAQHASS